MPSLRLITMAAVLTFVPSLPAVAQAERAQYVSDASYVLGTYPLDAADHAPAAMADAAHRLLDLLPGEQRERAALPLRSPERRQWTNLPAQPNAGGVRLGELDRAQMQAACDLMAALFSRQGFTKLRDIMLADDQLLAGGRPRRGFGTEQFSIVIFGTPSPTEPWAFQLDGHHVGVNLAMRGASMTMSPSFIGTQPEAFAIGSRTIRPLAREIELATELVNSLTDEQRAAAVVDGRRGQVRTGPGHDHEVPEARGVSCATFDARQRTLLMSLVGRWVNDLPADRATPRMARLMREIDRMRFAWSGPTAAGSDVSYVIQGPSLIIEYAGQDLGGNPLAHLHTMYRDPTNEYGGQLETHAHE